MFVLYVIKLSSSIGSDHTDSLYIREHAKFTQKFAILEFNVQVDVESRCRCRVRARARPPQICVPVTQKSVCSRLTFPLMYQNNGLC